MKNLTDIKISFYDAKPYDIESFTQINKKYGCIVDFFPAHLTPKTAALARGADWVCAFVNDDINKNVVDALQEIGIGLVALRSAGYNNVDLRYSAGKIRYVRVPAYSPHGVAEHALAMMLTLNRNTHRAFYRTRDLNFSINGLMGFEMYGKTAGVIGTGQIGRIMVEKLLGLGMRVIASDPYPAKAWAEEKGVAIVDLETLYRDSDIITLHCPLTSQTAHMINRTTIALMKPGVMIINTGRGKLIRTEDLVDALVEGRVGYAGLDVYEEEEDYFFEDYSNRIIKDETLARLLTFPNVLVTSHQAFFTREALANIADVTLNNIKVWSEDKPLENEVCLQVSSDGKCVSS